MRKFIFGVIIGALLGGGIAWAATFNIILISGTTGRETGTIANPLFIRTI